MNGVIITGKLKDIVNQSYRKLEYSLPSFNENGKLTQHLIIKNWLSDGEPLLMKLPIGTYIALRGHLDACEEFATIIVVEQFEVLKS